MLLFLCVVGRTNVVQGRCFFLSLCFSHTTPSSLSIPHETKSFFKHLHHFFSVLKKLRVKKKSGIVYRRDWVVRSMNVKIVSRANCKNPCKLFADWKKCIFYISYSHSIWICVIVQLQFEHQLVFIPYFRSLLSNFFFSLNGMGCRGKEDENKNIFTLQRLPRTWLIHTKECWFFFVPFIHLTHHHTSTSLMWCIIVRASVSIGMNGMFYCAISIR